MGSRREMEGYRKMQERSKQIELGSVHRDSELKNPEKVGITEQQFKRMVEFATVERLKKLQDQTKVHLERICVIEKDIKTNVPYLVETVSMVCDRVQAIENTLASVATINIRIDESTRRLDRIAQILVGMSNVLDRAAKELKECANDRPT